MKTPLLTGMGMGSLMLQGAQFLKLEQEKVHDRDTRQPHASPSNEVPHPFHGRVRFRVIAAAAAVRSAHFAADEVCGERDSKSEQCADKHVRHVMVPVAHAMDADHDCHEVRQKNKAGLDRTAAAMDWRDRDSRERGEGFLAVAKSRIAQEQTQRSR